MKNIISLIGLIISIFIGVIFSWTLVHVMAVFGIFLAAAYPIWWLIFPEKTPCFLCRAHHPHRRYCFFCRRASADTSPSGLISVFLNSLFLLVSSFFSAGITYGELSILRYLGYPATPQTVSFIIPSTGQFRLGEIFPMKIEMFGIEDPINAIQADISFDKNNLEVVEVSTEGSFANIFIQKEIDNNTGFVRLTGGLPNPGYSGDHGLFGTVYFKGKTPGPVQINFLPSSMVLANDGQGTNVLKDLSKVSYLILPERISPDQESFQNQAKTQVLGESTSKNQMIFYQEDRIKGDATSSEVPKTPAPKGSNPLKPLFNFIGKTDNILLSFWQKIFYTRK